MDYKSLELADNKEKILLFEKDITIKKWVLDDIRSARDFYLNQLADKFKSLRPIEDSLEMCEYGTHTIDLENLGSYSNNNTRETTSRSITLYSNIDFRIVTALEELGLESAKNWVNEVERDLDIDWRFDSRLVISKPYVNVNFARPAKINSIRLSFNPLQIKRFPDVINFDIKGKSLKKLAKKIRKEIE
jgi:hypothetical protein